MIFSIIRSHLQYFTSNVTQKDNSLNIYPCPKNPHRLHVLITRSDNDNAQKCIVTCTTMSATTIDPSNIIKCNRCAVRIPAGQFGVLGKGAKARYRKSCPSCTLYYHEHQARTASCPPDANSEATPSRDRLYALQ